MKQTVEEAAKEYTDGKCEKRGISKKYILHYDFDRTDIEDAFIAGNEWQSKQLPWISVEERLPEYSCWVLVAGKNYKYRILFYCRGKFYTNKSLIAYDGSVLFWMFIPSFDQILEANKDVLQRLK